MDVEKEGSAGGAWVMEWFGYKKTQGGKSMQLKRQRACIPVGVQNYFGTMFFLLVLSHVITHMMLLSGYRGYTGSSMSHRVIRKTIVRESLVQTVYTLFDLVWIFYISNGCVRFLYVYLSLLFAGIAKDCLVFFVLFRKGSFLLKVLFAALQIAKALRLVLSLDRINFYIARQKSVQAYGRSRNPEHFEYYLVLHGCCTFVLIEGMFKVLIARLFRDHPSTDNTNEAAVMLTAYVTKKILLIEWRSQKKRRALYALILLHITRIVFVFVLTKGETRLFANFIVRKEELYDLSFRMLIRSSSRSLNALLNFAMKFLLEVDNNITTFYYNFYLLKYCILLWRIGHLQELPTARQRFSLDVTG